MTKQEQDTHKNLSTWALHMVLHSGEGYTFHPEAKKGLEQGLSMMFDLPHLDHKSEIEMLLRLGWLFESRHDAPDIAETIIQVLAEDERALAALGIGAGKKARKLRARFAEFEGVSAPVTAPKYGAQAPAGSLKLSSFLEPGKEMSRGKKPTLPKAKRRSSTPPRRRIKT